MEHPINMIAAVSAKRVKKKDGIHTYPRIVLSGQWLADHGFQPGKPILVRRQLNRISITNIQPVKTSAYIACTQPSGLVRYLWAHETQPKKRFVLPAMPDDQVIRKTRSLIGTVRRKPGWSDPLPQLRVTGRRLAEAGFAPGDNIAVRCTMNTVTIVNIKPVQPFTYIDAPLPENTDDIPHLPRTLTVSQGYVRRKGGYRRYPSLRVGGRWLARLGFQPDEDIWIAYTLNTVSITNREPPKGNPSHHSIRAHVGRTPSGRHPFIKLSGKWLADAGFAPGARIEVVAAPHTITVRNVKPVGRSGYIELPFRTNGTDPSFYRQQEPGRYRRRRKAIIRSKRRKSTREKKIYSLIRNMIPHAHEA